MSRNYSLQNLSNKASDLGYKTIDLLKNTAIEVLIVGVLSLPIGIHKGHKHERARAELIQLHFSEVDQMYRDAAKQGKHISTLNRALPLYNDLFMKGFESLNEANDWRYTDKYRMFAEQLDNHLNLKHLYSQQYNLTDLIDSVPELGKKLREELKKYYVAAPQVREIAQNIGAAWDVNYIDNYHTETVECGEDADGNTQYCEETVDDIDDTYYYYHNEQGDAASNISKELFTKIPQLHFDTRVVKASKTNADGEYAVEKSRGVDLKGGLTQKEHLEIAAYWITKSTINANVALIDTDYPRMETESKKWDISKKTAQDEHYISWGKHPGPEEYDQAQRLSEVSSLTALLLEEIVLNVNSMIEDVPKLGKKLREYVALDFFGEKDGKHYDYLKKKKMEKKMYKEIKNDMFEMYRKNFKLAENPDRYRYGMVALYGLIALTIGCSIGAGIDYLTTKFGLYGKINYNSLKQSRDNSF